MFQAYSPSRMLAENTWLSIEATMAAVFACGMTLHIVSVFPQFGAPSNSFTTSFKTSSRSPISWLIATLLTAG